MMMPSWFGTCGPWLMVAGAWVGFGLLFAVALGLIVRAKAWRGRR